MQKYLLYNQGVKESGLPPKQEVVSSNLAGRTIFPSVTSNHTALVLHGLCVCGGLLRTVALPRARLFRCRVILLQQESLP